MSRVSLLSVLCASLVLLFSCSSAAPLEVPSAPAPAPAPEWRPVPVEGQVSAPADPSRDQARTAQEATEEPPPLASPFAGTRVVLGRLLDDPAQVTAAQGFARLRLDDEGLKEVSYPYPFETWSGPLKPLLRRLITVAREEKNYDMRTGLLLPAGAELRWNLPAGEGRVLHLSAAGFHRAFKGRGADEVKIVVRVDDEMAWEQSFSGRESSKIWDEAALPLPGTAAAVTVTVSSEKGTGLKAAIGLADVHVTVPVSESPDAAVHLRQGPNVVIVFIDALRADCVGPGNPGFPSVTPFIDERVGGGTAYTQNLTVSNQTRPSIVGFLQSQHPTVGKFHAKWWNFRQDKVDAYYARKPPLLPMLLSRAGYETVTFGRNHFQFGTTLLGLDPGFDRIWDNRKSGQDTERIIDRAVAWLEANRDRKFMLLVNISPPHQPYKAPEEQAQWTKARLAGYDGRLPARRDYLAEVHYSDVAVRRLMERADSLGLGDRTIFLVTADHGEVMRTEHSCRSELFETICHNSHGLTLYDEELRVPLLWWGWNVAPGAVHEHTVSHLDVAPTILDAVGLPAHPAHTGLSLWDELRGEGSAAERPDVAYVEMRLASGIRAWGWKYILHHSRDDARTPAWISGGESSKEELYDLTKDPFETKNLVRSQEPRRKQLRQLLGETRTLYRDYVDGTWDSAWNLEGAQPRAAPPIPGVATPPPSSPVPKTSSEQKFEARYHLAFSGEGPEIRTWTGTIRVEGRIVDAEYLGPDRAFLKALTGNSIHVALDVPPDAESLLRLRTAPPDAAVNLELEVDGSPLDQRRVYAGRDGLALLDGPAWGPADATAVLHSRTPPHRVPGEDLGVYVWRTGPRTRCSNGEEAFFEGGFEKEQIMDSTTRGILKDYGYWK